MAKPFGKSFFRCPKEPRLTQTGMEHDQSRKLLFSHAETVEDLLRGFVSAEWGSQMDGDRRFTEWRS